MKSNFLRKHKNMNIKGFLHSCYHSIASFKLYSILSYIFKSSAFNYCRICVEIHTATLIRYDQTTLLLSVSKPRLKTLFTRHQNVFRQSQVCCLFVCLVNWCQHWFEYFPNPPLNILSMAENVLAHHDKELLQHLVDCGITSQVTTTIHS